MEVVEGVNRSHGVISMFAGAVVAIISLSHPEKRICFQSQSPYHVTITRLFKIMWFSGFHNPGFWQWSTTYRAPDTFYFRLEELTTFCQFKKLSWQRVITVSAAGTGLHKAMPSCCLQSNLSVWSHVNLVWKFISHSSGMWFNQW